MNELLIAGMMTELSYMTTDEQSAAIALEEELTLDALAGVDVRARLIAARCSE